MQRLRAHILLALLAALPVAADEIPFDPAPVIACLTAGGTEACIGLGAGACIERDGPMSEGLCLAAENLWWMERAAHATLTLRQREAEVIARARQRGWPEPVPTLDAIATHFDAYRDAACGWRAAAWDGIHGGVEEMDCILGLNARHALWMIERARAE